RGAVLPRKGKSRITIWLDDAVLDAFRELVEKSGRGYQTLINEALGEYLADTGAPLDEATLRRIIREELKKVSRTGRRNTEG
ncbi:MAG: BrnA antitoxin family protein, partial [Gammaproteobacteria bacterium]